MGLSFATSSPVATYPGAGGDSAMASRVPQALTPHCSVFLDCGSCLCPADLAFQSQMESEDLPGMLGFPRPRTSDRSGRFFSPHSCVFYEWVIKNVAGSFGLISFQHRGSV